MFTHAYLGDGIPHIFRAKSNLKRKKSPKQEVLGFPEKTQFSRDYSTELARSATIIAYRKPPASSAAMTDKPRGAQSTLEFPKWNPNLSSRRRRICTQQAEDPGKNFKSEVCNGSTVLSQK